MSWMESQADVALINPILGQVLVAIFIFSTTIAFVLRMYVRVRMNRTFCWDDAWLIASQIFLLAIVSLYFVIQDTYEKALESKTEPPNDRLNTVSGVCIKH